MHGLSINNWFFQLEELKSKVVPDDPIEIQRREKVKEAMIHAWSSYEKYAWGNDELQVCWNLSLYIIYQAFVFSFFLLLYYSLGHITKVMICEVTLILMCCSTNQGLSVLNFTV